LLAYFRGNACSSSLSIPTSANFCKIFSRYFESAGSTYVIPNVIPFANSSPKCFNVSSMTVTSPPATPAEVGVEESVLSVQSVVSAANNFEVLFFDESIDGAAGKPTPFLSDTTQGIQAGKK